MRKIVASLFISLDGVVEAPETWAGPYFTDDIGQMIGSEMARAGTMLLGRVTYQTFAASFAGQTGGMAGQMNSIPKIVVSTTLETAGWQNTTVKPGQLDWHNSEALTGDAGGAVSVLKQRPGGNILLAGSGSLARTLAQRGLVDEYRLFICPVVLGTGERLFNLPSAARSLTLAETRTFDSGALLVRYATA